MAAREPADPTSRPAGHASADGAPAAPDYYSHGLNRLAYHNLDAGSPPRGRA